MARSIWTKWLACGVFSAGVVAAGNSAMAQQDVLVLTEQAIPYHVQPLDLRATRAGNVLYLAADEQKSAEANQGEYWLGVQIAALPEVAKQQLGIDQGLVVEEVMPNSPAAKAEIKKHDILIKLDDMPLKEPEDLIKSIEISKGKEMTIKIVRGGKDRTINVVAAKRPENDRVEARTARPQIDAEIKRLEEALQGLKTKAGKEGLGLMFARPAVVTPRVEIRHHDGLFSTKDEFPKDLSVRITKEGEEPTKIHVKRGDKEWDVTEDKLSELPDDVRPHVQGLLGRMLAPGFAAAAKNIVRVNPQGKIEGELKIGPYPAIPPVPFHSGVLPSPVPFPRAPSAPAAPTPPTPPKATRTRTFRAETGEETSDSKLDSIMNELKQLRKEVEELRSKSPGDKK
jgi:membrane-associated protease RseP (regulator of RpoE activity)